MPSSDAQADSHPTTPGSASAPAAPVQLSATKAAVATSHSQAATAAREMLESGGNAIDAAVAAVATLCVVTPSQVSLGGYGGCLIAYIAKERRVAVIDFDSCAPMAFRQELFNVDTKNRSHYGGLSVSVPAVVAGLDACLKQFGTRTFKDVFQHAIHLADDGIVLDTKLKKQMDDWAEKADEPSRNAYVPAGAVPGAGERWVQKDLAWFMRRLADEGPQAFYHGEIARTIVAEVHKRGGVLSEEDFASYRPRDVQPLKIDYRGYELFTPPPPAGGITSFQILKTLEHFDLNDLPRWGSQYLHNFAEASKQAWRDRIELLGDPDFVQIPIDKMLSDETAQQRADQIRRGTVASLAAAINGGPHTVNVVAIDPEGNVVSLMATQGFLFGSHIVVPGYGLVLGHGMSRFDFHPHSPNGPAPAKRMQHNMCPTIIMKDGHPRFAFGLPGGAKIVNVTAQIAINLIDHQLSPGESVTSARLHTEGDEPLLVSSAVSRETVAELQRLGHIVKREATVGGPANALAIAEDGKSKLIASGNGVDALVAL
jgi:gamma-glutamyltranspeptidase/glutathione hydrolase